MHTGESSEVMIRGYCYSSTGPLPSLPASKYGLVQNAGRGGIAGRDRTQVQNAGVRDPFHGLSALPKIHGTGSGPAGLHGIRETRDDATSGKLAGRGTKDMGLL